MTNRYENFTTLISKIYRSIIKLKSVVMEAKGLKSVHVSCLYHLYKSNTSLNATELSKLCGEDKAAISRTVDYLLKNEYLIYDFMGKKAYRSPITLTEKGKNVGKFIDEEIESVISKVSSEIDEHDRQTMYKCLNIILNNLENESKEHGE